MRSRPRLWPVLLFDVAMAAVFGLVAIGLAVAEDRPSNVLASAHSVAARIGWRESYETGLLIGLTIVAVAVITVISIAFVVRRRAKPAPDPR